MLEHVYDKDGSSQSSLTILPVKLAVMSKGQSHWKGDAAAEHMTGDRDKCLEISDACPLNSFEYQTYGSMSSANLSNMLCA